MNPQPLTTLLDLVFPRTCHACAQVIHEKNGALCWDCRADVRPVVFPFCSVCGNPVEGRISHDYVCYLCRETRRSFDRARSAARFEGVLQKALHDFKYNEALWLQDELVEMLMSAHAAHYDDVGLDAVACVPLFHVRERHRGYNQAELLGEQMARRLRKPFMPRVLSRTRETDSQTHLTAPQRVDNVKGAFMTARGGALKGKKLLLIDDVMTTGATLDECAWALKRGGAEAVYVLTVARGTRF